MLLFVPAAAQAQAPPPPAASQLVPKQLTPAPSGEAHVPVIEAAPPQTPPGAEKLIFQPSRIVLQGSLDTAKAQATLDTLAGLRMTVADFYKIAATIERNYATTGFPFVRVVVPEQRLVDGGEARLVAVDGFVESVDLEAVDPSLRLPVGKLLEPLVGRRSLKYAAVERQLSLAEDIAGATIRSAIARGDTPDGVKLVIQAKRKLLTGSVSFDNRQSPAFNKRSFTVQLALNSALGMGEQIYAYASPDPIDGKNAFNGQSPRRSFGGGFTMPMDTHGTKLTIEATRSITQPLGGFFATRDNFTRYSARLSHPFVKTRRSSLTVTASAEDSQETNAVPDFGIDISREHFRTLRLAADVNRSFSTSQLNLSLTGSAGFGDPADPAAPYSRAGTTRRFAKIEGTIGYSVGLFRGLVGTATLRGQAILRGGMPASELFALDGGDALSAFTSGAISAEEGFTGRFELKRSFPLTSTSSFTPFGYAAAGRAYARPRTIFDTRRASAVGGGINVDYQLPGSSVAFFSSVEVGLRHTDNAFFTDDSRVSVAAGVRF